MRISAKGRYALAAVIEIVRQTRENENVSVSNIANALGISKIYLEQVFSQLKKEGLLCSTKGSKGGHLLAREPEKITVWDVLITVENTLFERADSTVEERSPDIEMALNVLVFDALDNAVKSCLERITVQDLLDYSGHQRSEQAYMLNL